MIDVFLIPTPDDCRYMTVAECIQENGHRHIENAMKHLADGKPSWARGSMAKARRNFERSGKLAVFLKLTEGFGNAS